MKKIINRSGNTVPLIVGKIREKLVKACHNLDVNMVKLESNIDTIYQENITTKKIQESLINLAVSMTSMEDSDWSFVAGRLLMMEVEKEVLHNRGFSYGDFKRTVKSLCDFNIYDKRLLDYSGEELEIISTYIDPERDMLYDYAGANMLSSRYLIKYNNKTWELPQEVYMSIAMLLSINEEDRLSIVKDIYNALSLKKISLATPILANLRIPNGNLSSCFITAMDDNIDSIFYNVDSVAKISKNGGGVGLNISRVRSKGSWVKGYKNASGGIIPWIKIINDTAVAVNQQGRRAGAVTIALDSWHLDIEHFLELQTENGDQRGKAYDVYPQVVFSDLFMKRVDNNANWTLVDPYEIKQLYDISLADLSGYEFETIYSHIENNDNVKLKKTISAKELFKSIMKSQIETGMPYIFFKDTANNRNHNKDSGMIGNGNLCMESFSNFSPTINFKKERIHNMGMSTVDMGRVHTCNLVSLNLAEISKYNLEHYAMLSVRILDNTIDLTITPIEESNMHNVDYRTIGVGTMGLADYMAYNELIFEDSKDVISDIFERIALYTMIGSINLAKERGFYPMYKSSEWAKGLAYGRNKEWYVNNSLYGDDWARALDDMQVYGIRNGELTAIAPNTSTSLIMGSSASVIPIFSRFFIEKNQKGAVPRVAKYIKTRSWFYTEFKKIDPIKYVQIMGEIGKWTTQGVSMELLFDLNKDIKAKDIYDTIFEAWRSGCKTIYYTRTIQKNTDIMKNKEECESCSG